MERDSEKDIEILNKKYVLFQNNVIEEFNSCFLVFKVK